jgi:hypothetical protein
MGAGRSHMLFNRVGFHNVMKAIGVKGKQIETMRRGSGAEYAGRRKKEKEDAKERKRTMGQNGKKK